MRSKSPLLFRTFCASLAGLLLGPCLTLSAQALAPVSFTVASLPDSPDAPAITADSSMSSSIGTTTDQQAPAQQTADDSALQTKRILGIIPNFRSVSANQKLPAQTPKEKFITATLDSFDYSAILLPAVVAGYSQLTNQTPEFHQGAAGYGRYLWHSYVDQASENYNVEFIFPVLTHEDNRYYTKGRGGFLKRSGYALSRVVITRSDNDKEVFNISEVVGAGAAAGISNLYYPAPERTFGNTGQKWGVNIGIDAATFLFKEFWPDINNALFHTKD